MNRLESKVALITGAARGQGRSHAVRLAEEGADIIAVDICRQIDSVFYDMSTPEDLEETARLVQKTGRRIVTAVADVRDPDQLATAYAAGVAELGPADIVLPNAGIMPVLPPLAEERRAWLDCIDVMLTGVWNTIEVALPSMLERGAGGSIVVTSSVAGLAGTSISPSAGQIGYAAAKHGVVGVMRVYAARLAKDNIRVNTVHPSGCNTPMASNPPFQEYYNAHPEAADEFRNAMDVDMIQPIDVSNAIVFLCSDEARYITGVTLPVDAGFLVR